MGKNAWMMLIRNSCTTIALSQISEIFSNLPRFHWLSTNNFGLCFLVVIIISAEEWLRKLTILGHLVILDVKISLRFRSCSAILGCPQLAHAHTMDTFSMTLHIPTFLGRPRTHSFSATFCSPYTSNPDNCGPWCLIIFGVSIGCPLNLMTLANCSIPKRPTVQAVMEGRGFCRSLAVRGCPGREGRSDLLRLLVALHAKMDGILMDFGMWLLLVSPTVLEKNIMGQLCNGLFVFTKNRPWNTQGHLKRLRSQCWGQRFAATPVLQHTPVRPNWKLQITLLTLGLAQVQTHYLYIIKPECVKGMPSSNSGSCYGNLPIDRW